MKKKSTYFVVVVWFQCHSFEFEFPDTIIQIGYTTEIENNKQTLIIFFFIMVYNQSNYNITTLTKITTIIKTLSTLFGRY